MSLHKERRYMKKIKKEMVENRTNQQKIGIQLNLIPSIN